MGLRTFFGGSRAELWKRLSDELGGRYVDGGFWKGDKVQVEHGEWTITLDRYVVSTGKTTLVFTRLRAPYVNPEQFRFTISRKGFFTELAKWFGMQDVVVGHPRFDADFVIKGNDERKLRQLFDSPRLRELLEAQPKVHLQVRDDEGWFGATYPPDTDVLYFHVIGIIKDRERLKSLFELFAETLEQLCRIGAAYEKPTDPQL
ncbi:MAG: DUF3137 domain-containing protein [Planctomycetes bacterium]|nr:DUF3137 domain-containing protein [Planctomycetota bacterium]